MQISYYLIKYAHFSRIETLALYKSLFHFADILELKVFT